MTTGWKAKAFQSRSKIKKPMAIAGGLSICKGERQGITEGNPKYP